LFKIIQHCSDFLELEIMLKIVQDNTALH